MAAAFAAAVCGVLWYRGAAVVAAISGLITVGTFLALGVGWVRTKFADTQIVPRQHAAALFAGGTALLLASLLLPARAFDPQARPEPPQAQAPPSATGTPSLPATASPAGDRDLTRYCGLALEFLGHAQKFSGKGWQGRITRRDFDPIIQSANAALDAAPQEMRAPMTVLASSYEAAQDGWSDDNMIKNAGPAMGTIFSPSARAAADAVDAYENEHCF